jgi:hypothetical protein
MSATQILKCSVEDDELVIRIGIDTLAFAFHESDENNQWDHDLLETRRVYTVIDDLQFAHDVALAANYEAENGSTPLTTFLDDMMQAALNDGSTGVEEASEVEAMAREEAAK